MSPTCGGKAAPLLCEMETLVYPEQTAAANAFCSLISSAYNSEYHPKLIAYARQPTDQQM